MKNHTVYFYGSTKIICGYNSLSSNSCRERNQIIGFNGADVNPELVEYGEKCFCQTNGDNEMSGETGVLPQKHYQLFRPQYKRVLFNF